MKKQVCKSINNVSHSDRMTEITKAWLFPAIAFIVFLAVWQFITVIFDIPAYLVPPPSTIINYIANNYAVLFKDTAVTMYEAIAGFILGSAFGIIMAIGFAHCKFFERAFYPYMIALKAIPIVAIAPLLVLWFGNGVAGKIIMSSIICFFPVIVNTTTGLKSLDQDSLDLFSSLAATRWHIFIKLRVPNSLPYVFSALKISSTLSVVGAIVGEFSGAKSGLGYLMLVSVYQLDTESLYAGIFAASLSGVLFFGFIVLLEKIVLKWHNTEITY